MEVYELLVIMQWTLNLFSWELGPWITLVKKRIMYILKCKDWNYESFMRLWN